MQVGCCIRPFNDNDITNYANTKVNSAFRSVQCETSDCEYPRLIANSVEIKKSVKHETRWARIPFTLGLEWPRVNYCSVKNPIVIF